ncbi:hypothetical protein VTK56DRAFT_1814 [Thermocarpiscus australiensis]
MNDTALQAQFASFSAMALAHVLWLGYSDDMCKIKPASPISVVRRCCQIRGPWQGCNRTQEEDEATVFPGRSSLNPLSDPVESGLCPSSVKNAITAVSFMQKCARWLRRVHDSPLHHGLSHPHVFRQMHGRTLAVPSFQQVCSHPYASYVRSMHHSLPEWPLSFPSFSFRPGHQPPCWATHRIITFELRVNVEFHTRVP